MASTRTDQGANAQSHASPSHDEGCSVASRVKLLDGSDDGPGRKRRRKQVKQEETAVAVPSCSSQGEVVGAEMCGPIDLMPTEIITGVMSYLSAYDRLRCARVCRRWRETSKASILWKELNFSKVSLRLKFATKIIRTYGSEHTARLTLEGWFTPENYIANLNHSTFSVGLLKVISKFCVNLKELHLKNMLWGSTEKDWIKLKDRDFVAPPLQKVIFDNNCIKFSKMNNFMQFFALTLTEVVLIAWNPSYMHNLVISSNVKMVRLIFLYPLQLCSSNSYVLPTRLIQTMASTASLCIHFPGADREKLQTSVEKINAKLKMNLQPCVGCTYCE